MFGRGTTSGEWLPRTEHGNTARRERNAKTLRRRKRDCAGIPPVNQLRHLHSVLEWIYRVPSLKLAPDETQTLDCQAWLLSGAASVQGRLTLTSERLVFRSNATRLLGSQQVQISLARAAAGAVATNAAEVAIGVGFACPAELMARGYGVEPEQKGLQ